MSRKNFLLIPLRLLNTNITLFSKINPSVTFRDNSSGALNLKFSNNFSTQQQSQIKCWKCGVQKQSIYDLFCGKCQVIQEPHERSNYFKVLDVEESFDLNAKQLRDKYRHMQSILHPDKFGSRTSEEKVISEEYSSLVNKAYDVLQSPLKRAMHLFWLKGGVFDERERNDSAEFLMEIMELNEEVENADTEEKLKKLEVKNSERVKEIESEISDSFKNSDFKKVKEGIVKLKYYMSVASHINGLMREKGIVD